MDQRLIRTDPARVRQLIARAYLAAPAVSVGQGDITLAPHQVDAASRILSLLARRGGAVLADATGLGKTYVAIAVARLRSPALIVGPAALRGMWRDSLGRTTLPAQFISYEELSRGRAHGKDIPRLLILDEAHHARNPSARRYAAIADLAWGAEVLLLTATPIHNRSRDLRALVALFLGSRAHTLPDDELRRFIVRREPGDVVPGVLPKVESTRWIAVGSDPGTLRAIRALPPAVPPAGGGTAHALLQLGLIRAWTSSGAALRGALRRRLQRSVVLEAALESGRLPDRRDLNAWPAVDDAIQLGFPELIASNAAVDIAGLKAAVAEHAEGVRAIIASLDRREVTPDDDRIRALRSVRSSHSAAPMVAFTQFADTAEAMFRSCAGQGGVALVTGRGARIASGPVPVEEIVRGLDTHAEVARAMPLDCLIATDVLSEGFSLRRAATLVHLDLPWTIARLEQRIGRLRRLGSLHRSIAVYAIGPPVESRELLTVVRALQRKARLSANLVGDAPLAHARPLLGARLERATGAVSRRDGSGAVEQVRDTLREWVEGHARVGVSVASDTALALVHRGDGYRLIAVSETGVSENARDVYRALNAVESPNRHRSADIRGIVDAIDAWLEQERARDLAGLTSDTASPAHAAVLRALQSRLAGATRVERTTLARRIERCRQLVIASRGAGAELALQRFAEEDDLDPDVLAYQLEARLPNVKATHTGRLVAVLAPDRSGVAAWLTRRPDLTDDSTRRGPPRSSSPLAERVAASG